MRNTTRASIGLNVLVIFILCCGATSGKLVDALYATCRLTANGVQRGTGICYRVDDEYVWILTAGHCTLNPDKTKSLENMGVEFAFTGRWSNVLPATISWNLYHSYDWDDIAILRVKVKDFQDYPLPKPLAVAHKSYQIEDRQPTWSYGCPNGGWPTGWKGIIISLEENAVYFQPAPIPGRSGSALLDPTGTKIIGIIIRREVSGSSKIGLAVPFMKFDKIIPWRQNDGNSDPPTD